MKAGLFGRTVIVFQQCFVPPSANLALARRGLAPDVRQDNGVGRPPRGRTVPAMFMSNLVDARPPYFHGFHALHARATPELSNSLAAIKVNKSSGGKDSPSGINPTPKK